MIGQSQRRKNQIARLQSLVNMNFVSLLDDGGCVDQFSRSTATRD
jgi:hypothetical protein